MSILHILPAERVTVSSASEGVVRDKAGALRRLAELLASGAPEVDAETIFTVLDKREQLQSTGVGDGVAVPHGYVDALDEQLAALLICPEPIDFDAIDGQPVSILFALVGPKGAPAQHLKVLARVSRLVRSTAFRDELLASTEGRAAHALIAERDRQEPAKRGRG